MKKIINYCENCQRQQLMYSDGVDLSCPVCGNVIKKQQVLFDRKQIKKNRRRQISTDYVAWIHSWPCCISGCTNKIIHAHHTVPRSRLGSDFSCVPLCHEHHIGVSGVHNVGLETFKDRFKVDFQELCSKYKSLYESGKIGPNPINHSEKYRPS